MSSFGDLARHLNNVSEIDLKKPAKPKRVNKLLDGSAAAASLASRLGLRRSAMAYRGPCPRPKCDGTDTFTLSFKVWPDGKLHAHCRACGDATSVPINDYKPQRKRRKKNA